MKRGLAQRKLIPHRFSRLVITGAALLLAGSLAGICLAARFDPPTGTWDMVTSGSGQPGLAYLTFSHETVNGGTFSGFALVVGLPPSSVPPTVSDGRNVGGDAGRGGLSTDRGAGSDIGRDGVGSVSTSPSGTQPPTGVGSHFVFGFTNLSGLWQFDSKGRVTGSFDEVLTATTLSTNYGPMLVDTNIDLLGDGSLTTNIDFIFTTALYETNLVWSPTNSLLLEFINTNFTVSFVTSQLTNPVSFVGTVVPGRRFNLVSSTSFGKVTYRGVPTGEPGIDLPNLDATTWSGTKSQKGNKFAESFVLNSSSAPNPPFDFPGLGSYPNIYWTTNGVGTNYSFFGVAVFSRQKRIGFVFRELTETNSTLRASVGAFTSNSRITKATTQGVIEPAVRIRFDAVKQP